MLHKNRELTDLWNPVVVPYIALVDILRLVAIESATEVPNRTELPLLIIAHVLVEIATAVERLVVVGEFLNDIEACKGVHIEVLPDLVGVLVAIDEVI
jgi:hypothetical protein